MSFIQEDGGMYRVSNPVSADQIIGQAQLILEQRVFNSEYLKSPAITRDYLRLMLTEHDREVFAGVFLTAQHQVISYEELFYGTIDGAPVYPRVIARRALELNAAAVIIAHQHPSGIATPSNADKQITERIVETLALMDVRVLDHFIVTVGSYYSFAENGLLQKPKPL